MAYVGIDLGTSTCEIAYYSNGQAKLIPDMHGDIIIPSYVGVAPDGEFVYGRVAKHQFIPRRKYTAREFKKLMGTNAKIKLGDKHYSPEEISAMMLAYLKKSAENYLHEKINEVIVTVPANFDDNQRSATMKAIEMSGLRCERIINEPTAAAMTYGLDNVDEESTILVFDFGGGTLDITILEMYDGVLEVKSSYGDTQLGGKDLDERMKGIIIDKLRAMGVAVREQDPEMMAKVYTAAEDLKIRLSTERKASIDIDNLIVEDSFDTRYTGSQSKDRIIAKSRAASSIESANKNQNTRFVDITVEVSRQEFEQEIEDLVKRAENVLKEALKAAHMSVGNIDNVILVGGTTKVPIVRERIEELMNKKLRTDLEPDTAIAKGAAIQIAIKNRLINSEFGLLVTDVCPYSLGTEISQIVNNFVMEGIYHEMIKRNTTIPCEKKDEFVPVYNGQEEMIVDVYQTLNENCKFVSDAKLIGEFAIKLAPDLPIDENVVSVTYSYDINGNLQVSAKHLTTGVTEKLTIDKSKIINEDGRKPISNDLLEKSRLYKTYSSTIENVERKLKSVRDQKLLNELQSTLEMLKRHIVDDNKSLAEAVESKLLDMLMQNDLL